MAARQRPTPSSFYSLHGLLIASDIECPELPAVAAGPADLVIGVCEVAPHLDSAAATGALFEASENEFLISINDVARFLIRRGTHIDVDIAPGADLSDVRAFLLGSVMSAALTQRGLLVVHASAVATPAGGAILFAGYSGRGKSTLAAAMTARGYPLVSDDLAPVAVGPGGTPVVAAGTGRIRLWPDALTALGDMGHDWARVRPSVPKVAAHLQAVDAGSRLPLSALFILRPYSDEGIRLESLAGTAKFTAIRQHVCHRLTFEQLGRRAQMFAGITSLAAAAPVTRVYRPRDQMQIGALADAVIAALP